MLGRITFAWRHAGHMDADIKMWRFAADWFNDGAVLVQLAGLLVPGEYTLAIACSSALCQALCSVAAASSKAALSTHFAIHENMADLAAKEGSQETLVGLLGLGLGTLFLHLTPEENVPLNLLLCLVFVGLHLLANYHAVRSVCLHTLNGQRLYLLARAFLLGDGTSVPSPQALLRDECIFWSGPIRLGVSVERVLAVRAQAQATCASKDQPTRSVEAAFQGSDGLPAFLCAATRPGGGAEGRVLVALRAGCDDPSALLEAYFAAVALHLGGYGDAGAGVWVEAEGRGKEATRFHDFLRLARAAGWETEPARSKLVVGGWRYSRGVGRE
jgi:hypothetical protein